MSCGIGCRCGSDPALLWLWCRPAAVALIQPLARELPCAAYAAHLAVKKKQKNNCMSKIQLIIFSYIPCPQTHIPHQRTHARVHTHTHTHTMNLSSSLMLTSINGLTTQSISKPKIQQSSSLFFSHHVSPSPSPVGFISQTCKAHL